MSNENPNYQPNALSRFYESLIAGTGRTWIGLAWMPRNYLKLLGAFSLVLLPFWLWMIYEVWGEFRILTGDTIPRDKSDDHRNIAYALGVTITALAGLLAAPLILIRTWVSERHATTAEQGLITDRITKAVEQLGAEKTVKRREFKQRFRVDSHRKPLLDDDDNPIPATRIDGTPLGEWETAEETTPNLEVRLGAIYALERIAQDSERDHIPIMETLCAYIRQNAPAGEAKDHSLGDWPDWPEDAPEDVDEGTHVRRDKELLDRHEARIEWVRTLKAPRVDIQAALSVIGRRAEERIAHERRQRKSNWESGSGFRLDLRDTNLQNADLTRSRLDNALLDGARLEGAHLMQARLEGANLMQARLEGANLMQARLEGANLMQARLEGANLRQARLEGANLRQARLEGAHLTEARLEGANLMQARLEGANLMQARLEGANLRQARLEGANLRQARLEGANLRQARLEGANLRQARLEGANLMQARLEGANLRQARLEGANLRQARLERANLRQARLERADLHSANLKSADLSDWTCARTSLRSADFTEAKHLTQDHVNAAFGDSATILPDGIAMPDHWDGETVEWHEEDPKYQAWLDDGAPPGKPKPLPDPEDTETDSG